MSSEPIIIHYKNATDCRLICNHGIVQELADEFQFYATNYKHTPLFKAGRWDGKIRFVRMDGTFPVGILKKVVQYLVAHGYTNLKLEGFPEGLRTPIDYSIDHIELPFEPHDFQLAALTTFCKSKRVNFISPTASGKSLIMYLLSRCAIEHIGDKILIIVPNISLATQLKADYASYSEEDEGFDVEELVHVIADGTEKRNDKSITISTWQSLQHIKDPSFFSGFDVVGIDEVHGAKGKAITAIVGQCVNAHHRFGLTGTIEKKDQADVMTIEANIGQFIRLTDTETLMERGIVAQMHINCIKINHKVMGAKPSKYTDEINYIIKNDSRNEFIVKLADKTKGNTLVLFNTIEHGEHLLELLKTRTDKEVLYVSGKIKGVERERIRKYAEANNNLILVCSYGTYSTGVNIKNLHNVIFAHPTKSLYRVLQSIGRGLRLHDDKEKLRLFDISDDLRKNPPKGAENHTLRHFMRRLEIYASESFTFDIKEVTLAS